MNLVRALLKSNHGVGAAEFALVLPLLLLMLFGIIDGGRFLWEYNRAEKATQVGARFAAVTDMAAGGLQDYSFATDGSPDVPAGDKVDTGNFEVAECTSTSCTCTGAVCGSIALDSTAFEAIVTRMRQIYPAIDSDNVTITYKNVGLGYAGDPTGPDVAPLITVALKDLTFRPMSTMIFGLSFAMPDFRASLTAEDASGEFSN